MRVAVLMGGSSEERGVSFASGCQVSMALRSLGHEVVSIDAAVGVMPRELEERVLASEIGEADVPGPLGAQRGDNRLPEAKVLPSEPTLRDVDVAFIAMHGGAGEDGRVQTLLDFAGVPYAGTGPVGCALAMDKDLTKRLLRDEGVATPHWIAGETPAAAVVDRLGLPTIVKPQSGGSSVRLTLARDVTAWGRRDLSTAS